MTYIELARIVLRMGLTAWLLWVTGRACRDKKYDKACAALLALLVIK